MPLGSLFGAEELGVRESFDADAGCDKPVWPLANAYRRPGNEPQPQSWPVRLGPSLGLPDRDEDDSFRPMRSPTGDNRDG